MRLVEETGKSNVEKEFCCDGLDGTKPVFGFGKRKARIFRAWLILNCFLRRFGLRFSGRKEESEW